MKEFDKDFQDYLDGLSDEELLGFLCLRYSEVVPIWEKCTKEEYDKHVPNLDELDFGKPLWETVMIMHTFDYRRVPYYHNGGGILDQISDKEPDGYTYEKRVGEKKCIIVGAAMMDYIYKRGLDKKFNF